MRSRRPDSRLTTWRNSSVTSRTSASSTRRSSVLVCPPDRVHINIQEYGNTSAGSVGLVFAELADAGRVKDGDIVVFVAFGGGLTWASSVWRI